MTQQPGKLNGKAVLITGGGTGIGLACAERLVADGAVVTICGRTEASLVSASEKIAGQAAHGGSVQYAVGDVTNERSVKEIIAKAAQPAGSLHGVVANAGGGSEIPVPLAEVDSDRFRATLDLNLMGVLYCLKYSVPLMIEAGGGSFVGMSSLAGHITHRGGMGYGVAKAGMEALMRNAADEYGEHQLRFNAVRPGLIATEMIATNMPIENPIYAEYIDNTPMGDAGKPEDVAELTRFLIGPESRWITGQCINVDGGNSLRSGANFGQLREMMEQALNE